MIILTNSLHLPTCKPTVKSFANCHLQTELCCQTSSLHFGHYTSIIQSTQKRPFYSILEISCDLCTSLTQFIWGSLVWLLTYLMPLVTQNLTFRAASILSEFCSIVLHRILSWGKAEHSHLLFQVRIYESI